MKSFIRILLIALIIYPSTAVAGDLYCNIEAGLVSTYVWRGMRQAGISFQPSLKIGYKRFSFSAWGNTEIAKEGQKEVDLYLNYDILDNLTVELSDNWSTTTSSKYFQYGSGTEHSWEARVTYTLPFEKCPLSLSWGTMFAGNDYNDNGKRAFSSYFIMTYPFNIKMIDLEAEVGMSPYKSNGMYGCNGFSLNEIALKAGYTVKACKFLSIPIYTQLIGNPATKDLYFLLGVSINTDF
mgnify:FL=1